MENMKIDIVLLTKNSFSRCEKGVFEECLETVKKEIPIKNLIVVDCFSKDDTLRILKNHFPDKLKLIQSDALRGKAREIGIKNVETEYFMFVDDDVILSPCWFDKAVRFFENDPNVGAVWGVDRVYRHGKRTGGTILMSKVRNMTPDEIMIRNFKIRGGTHDILIKTEIVKNIVIPADLHIYEDAFIKEYIEHKGYKVIPTSDVWCIHKRPKSKWNVAKGVQLAFLEQKYGYLHYHTLYYVLRNFVLSFPKALLIYVLSRNIGESVDQFLYYTMMLIGILKTKPYHVKRIDRFELMEMISDEA